MKTVPVPVSPVSNAKNNKILSEQLQNTNAKGGNTQSYAQTLSNLQSVLQQLSVVLSTYKSDTKK